MKEKYFINAKIIDPSQNLDVNGGLIVNEKGKIKAIGKSVGKGNIPSKADKIDLKGKILIPGIIDMKVFIGEPGFEYKENFRSLSEAALSGGVTSVVSMPNTSPVIDNVSMVDFIVRRGRDKSNINIFPSATLTRNMDGKLMTEFGLLSKRGIIGFTDATKTVQNSEIMSRIMNYASELDVLVMQHPEDYELSKNRCINEGAALHFGIKYPEKAISLTVAGSGYGAEKQYEDYFRTVSKDVASQFMKLGSKEFSKIYAKASSRIPFLIKDKTGWEDFLKILSEHSNVGASMTMKGVQAKRPSLYDLEDEIKNIEIPTLIVLGDEDDHCINPGIFLKRCIKASGLLILPKTGHTINLEEPSYFNNFLSDFFSQVENNKWLPRDPRSNPQEIMKT